MSDSIPHSPHAPPSPAALATARRLFARGDWSHGSDADLLVSAERIGTCVPDALARWFGPYGSLALVTRALAIAEVAHRSLAEVTLASSQSPRILGLAASARAHGAQAMAEGVVALLAALVELLGRLIGDDLAMRLLEPCSAPTLDSASAAASPNTNGRAPTPRDRSGESPPNNRLSSDPRAAGDDVPFIASEK